jgi:hypothetical protein
LEEMMMSTTKNTVKRKITERKEKTKMMTMMTRMDISVRENRVDLKMKKEHQLIKGKSESSERIFWELCVFIHYKKQLAI